MENKLINRTIQYCLLFTILIILQFQQVTPNEGGQNVAQDYPERPLLKLLVDTISLLRKSQESSWEKIKTVIHDLQMQFSPPNLDFRGVGKGGLKEAVGKSFDISIESVEETAKSAAEFFGEAIHRRAEKVKENADSDKDTKDEL
ncbi:uncharacterized protein LOC131624108 [Vicia villosa]|uniref:uncharacterized protein LOC131624108 n=1 Tax=Vicia villosa TaxID=3911 RepID=UPI00273B7A74|nr:uncharacterized protein LOC131624108 [Vicia villosa]